jgi:hypothetical protein
MPGVRLINGQTLPPKGLTVATPAPLYIKGNYNVASSGLGSHNTSASLPASVVADAVTVLSGNWNDANSTKGLSSRVAANTTVNAAFLAGIVETDSAFGGYSGGVENYPRFLEKWDGKQLTYNGSMVVLFPSAIAKAKWKYGDPVYTAPMRDWAFDTNFSDPTKLPPGSPMVRLMVRGTWSD